MTTTITASTADKSCARCKNEPRSHNHCYCLPCRRIVGKLYETDEYKAERDAKKAAKAAATTKVCSVCKVEKPLAEFYTVGGNAYSRCKPCHLEIMRVQKEKDPENRREIARRSRQKSLRQEYGITLEEYDAMWLGQDGRCAICQEEQPLQVDHCHTSGKVRGLLCGKHNRALGLFDDNPELLWVAIAYLRAHGRGKRELRVEVPDVDGTVTP